MSSFVTSDGCRINFEIIGSGPALLFFNGSGASIALSRPLIDIFARSFTVLVHDQRGLGESDVSDGPYSMARYASDGWELLRHVGWNECLVFGISFGGMVAQEFACTHPRAVRRLVLACTSPGGGGGSSYPLETLVDLPAEERGRLMMTIVDSRFDDEWFESHPQDRVFVAPRAELTGSAAIGYRRQLEARRHHDVWDRLALVDSPTLVTSGTHDGIAAPANGRAIASRIPRSEFREYVGGHMFMFQDSRALPDMMEFLSTKDNS